MLAGIKEIFLTFTNDGVRTRDLSQMFRKCPNISDITLRRHISEDYHDVKIELAPLFDRYREQLRRVNIEGLEVIDVDAAMAALSKLPNCTNLALNILYVSYYDLQDRHIAMLSPEFLRRLKMLDLCSNYMITNATLDYLGRCGMPNLTFLNLNYCPEITDEMMLQIVNDATNFPLLTSPANAVTCAHW